MIPRINQKEDEKKEPAEPADSSTASASSPVAPSPFPEGWYVQTDDMAICHTCFQRKMGAFIVQEKSVTCLPCAVKGLSRKASKLLSSTASCTAEMFNEIFDPSAPPLVKIGMLSQREKLIQALTALAQNESDSKAAKTIISKILENIILQLGYNTDHPLSHLLQNITLIQISQSSTYFLPALIALLSSHRNTTFPDSIDKQRFRYNLAQTLVHLAPGKPAVQQFIAEVIKEAKAHKDYYVAYWFHHDVNGYYAAYGNRAAANSNLAKTVQTFMLPKDLLAPISVLTPFHFEMIIDFFYTVNDLKSLYSLYFSTLHKKTNTTLSFTWPDRKAQKAHYVRIFCEILMDKTLLHAFLHKLPSRLAQAFLKMVWEYKSYTVDELIDSAESESGNLERQPARYSYGYAPEIPKKLQLFQAQQTGHSYWEKVSTTFYIDHSLANMLKYVLPYPDSANLHFAASPDPGLSISTNRDILIQLPYLTTYIDQIGLKRSKNGSRILKSSIKEAGKLCTIDEPYPSMPGIDTIRATMLLQLLEDILPANRENNPSIVPEKYLKELFNHYFPLDSAVPQTFITFLDYLKSDHGWWQMDYIDRNSKQQWTQFRNLLTQLVEEEWITIENVFIHLLTYNIYPYPVDALDLSKNFVNFYFNKTSSSQYSSGYDKFMLHDSNLRETFLLPYLKTLFFVLNTLGVVDVALGKPVNPYYQDKDHAWLSSYDGIAEISLTPLGAWLIEKTDTLEMPGRESAVHLTLDTVRLLITVEGSDPLVELTLGKMAVSIGPGYYQVKQEIFLKDCADSADIENMIEMFRANICEKPPQVWEDFFTSLLYKMFPLKLITDQHLMFSLDPGNTELIQLIFSDPSLKNLIVRAEDYHIFIKAKNYRAVRKRLAEFGYLLSDQKMLEI